VAARSHTHWCQRQAAPHGLWHARSSCIASWLSGTRGVELTAAAREQLESHTPTSAAGSAITAPSLSCPACTAWQLQPANACLAAQLQGVWRSATAEQITITGLIWCHMAIPGVVSIVFHVCGPHKQQHRTADSAVKRPRLHRLRVGIDAGLLLHHCQEGCAQLRLELQSVLRLPPSIAATPARPHTAEHAGASSQPLHV
jgi:hypothetical protein